jgi:alcohol dehydrogenase
MYVPGYYEFYSPVETIAGYQALAEIPGLLRRLNACRPMVVTDKGVVGAGLLDTVCAAVEPDVRIRVFDDEVPSDPDFQTVGRLARRYRENGCDSLIAVGGGSIVDAAKGVNILVSENAYDLNRFAGADILKRPLRPLVAVPTTAGTGSETTRVAVIMDNDRHTKLPFASPYLLPDAAVLDPRMTQTLPRTITAATAMGALAHAIEAYTCLAKNPLSDAYSLLAVELIGKNLMGVLKEPDDADGRLALAIGANLAGVAFSNSMVGMVHALGHAAGAICGVPHGNCVAILLPYGLEYNMHKNGSMVAELLLPLGGSRMVAHTPVHLRANQVVAIIRRLNQHLYQETGGRHPRFFKEMTGPEGNARVPAEALEAIAEKALDDSCIFFNPEELDHDDLVMVLSHAWAGTPLDKSRVRKGSLQIR